MSLLGRIFHAAGQRYLRRICSEEFSGQQFKNHSERPLEYSFALRELAEKSKSVLDVGTGDTAWPHLLRTCGYVVTAIDNVRDYWPEGMVNRHWEVLDVDILNPSGLTSKFDAVTCISVLEHIPDHLTAMRNMAGLLSPGGRLVLTTPFSANNHDPNVYKRPDALYGSHLPYGCRSSSNAELKQWLDLGLTLERSELWRLFTGPVWATGQRTAWVRAGSESDPHQLGLFSFRKA